VNMATYLTYGLFAGVVAAFTYAIWCHSSESAALLSALPFAPASAASEIKAHFFFYAVSAVLTRAAGGSNSFAMVRTPHWLTSVKSPVGLQLVREFILQRRRMWLAFGFVFLALGALSTVPR
jgi:hypothetical protein